MHSIEEPNSFFGGMAASDWNSKNKIIEDPANESSWLFKLEARYNKYFDLFILMKESIFINGNALTRKKLLLGIKAYFFHLREIFLKIVDHALEFF